MSTSRRTIAAVTAVVLAVLGIIALVRYVNQADDRAFQGTKLVPAIRVVKAVPAGTKATDLDDSVEVVELPKTAVPDTALTTLDSVADQVTTASLAPGEVLVSGRFGDADGTGGGAKDGAVKVPDGLQEVTIRVSSVRAVGGTLKAGDTVGVVSTFDPERQTNFAANQVLVLSIKSVQGTGAEDAATDDVVVRLAVTSLEAEKIVHTAELGHVYLTKQGDDATVDRRLITSEGVLK